MQSIIYIFFALGVGAIVSIYMPMISESSKIIGSPLAGNILFFSIALVTSVIIFTVIGDVKVFSKMNAIPPFYFIAGVLSAFMILGVSILVPVLGIRKFIILIITGQILMSVIAGHFGILGVSEDTISMKKILGVVLILSGVFFTVSE